MTSRGGVTVVSTDAEARAGSDGSTDLSDEFVLAEEGPAANVTSISIDSRETVSVQVLAVVNGAVDERPEPRADTQSDVTTLEVPGDHVVVEETPSARAEAIIPNGSLVCVDNLVDLESTPEGEATGENLESSVDTDEKSTEKLTKTESDIEVINDSVKIEITTTSSIPKISPNEDNGEAKNEEFIDNFVDSDKTAAGLVVLEVSDSSNGHTSTLIADQKTTEDGKQLSFSDILTEKNDNLLKEKDVSSSQIDSTYTSEITVIKSVPLAENDISPALVESDSSSATKTTYERDQDVDVTQFKDSPSVAHVEGSSVSGDERPPVESQPQHVADSVNILSNTEAHAEELCGQPLEEQPGRPVPRARRKVQDMQGDTTGVTREFLAAEVAYSSTAAKPAREDMAASECVEEEAVAQTREQSHTQDEVQVTTTRSQDEKFTKAEEDLDLHVQADSSVVPEMKVEPESQTENKLEDSSVSEPSQEEHQELDKPQDSLPVADKPTSDSHENHPLPRESQGHSVTEQPRKIDSQTETTLFIQQEQLYSQAVLASQKIPTLGNEEDLRTHFESSVVSSTDADDVVETGEHNCKDAQPTAARDRGTEVQEIEDSHDHMAKIREQGVIDKQVIDIRKPVDADSKQEMKVDMLLSEADEQAEANVPLARDKQLVEVNKTDTEDKQEASVDKLIPDVGEEGEAITPLDDDKQVVDITKTDYDNKQVSDVGSMDDDVQHEVEILSGTADKELRNSLFDNEQVSEVSKATVDNKRVPEASHAVSEYEQITEFREMVDYNEQMTESGKAIADSEQVVEVIKAASDKEVSQLSMMTFDAEDVTDGGRAVADDKMASDVYNAVDDVQDGKKEPPESQEVPEVSKAAVNEEGAGKSLSNDKEDQKVMSISTDKSEADLEKTEEEDIQLMQNGQVTTIDQHQAVLSETSAAEDEDLLTSPVDDGQMVGLDQTTPADQRQVEGCGPETAASHADQWRAPAQGSQQTPPPLTPPPPGAYENHVTADPRPAGAAPAMEAAPPPTSASPVPPPSASRLPPDGDEFPASYTDPSPPKMDSPQIVSPAVPSKPWASPAPAPATPAKALPAPPPPPPEAPTPGGRRARDDASERSVRDKIAMFSQPASASPAPAPSPAPVPQQPPPMASTPLRRRYSSAADLPAPPPATAAPAPRRSGLDRAHSFLDLSPTAPAATTAVPAVSAQPSAASLPRRTSFSGTGLLHSRSQSLLDVRAHRNSIAGDPRVGQMMERRQRGLSKLRGLVIPEKVPELPVLLPDLPEIKSVPPPTATTRSSWSPSPAVGGHRTTNWNQSGAPPVIRPASWQPQNTSSSQWNHLNGVKPSNPPSTNLKSSWSQSTVNNRETSRPSWSSTASVPKYSPAFKRKSLSLSSSVSSSLSSSREELRPLFDSNSNNQPPPLPPSKPPPLLPPTEPKSLESIASSPTRSDISFEYKVGSIKSPVTTPDADILTSNSKGGGGDESDDSAVSSSRSSQYSPPSSPMRKMLTSSTESSVYTSRVLKPRSVEAINRKNVLSSARHSSGRDLKAGSPLIQRKMPDESEDTKNEINSSVLVPTDDCNDDIVQGTYEFIHNYKDKSAEKYGMDDQLNKNEDSNRILLSKTDGVSSGAFRNIDSQETTETNIGNSGKNTANTQYKTEEKIFTTAHANVEQKNNVMHQKIDDRIAMMHHRVDDKSNTVIQRSMEIITTVVNNNAEDKLHGVQREISKDALPNSVRDGDSLTQQRRLYTSEERSDIEMLDDHHDSEEKNNKFSTNRNRFETDDSSKHQFAIARRKFEESSAHKVRPSSLKNEGSKIMTSQKKSDDNSAILRRQDAIDDITLEMNGNDLSLDGKSRPVAAPRRYVAQWEATQSNKASPVSSPVSPVFPAVPPKPVSKMSNGNAGGIYRQDSTATIIKHARGSSLDSTASDDNTLRDSVLYGSVSSLSSASSIITPQELQQLMNEANQSLDESGVSSPVMLEVVVLHRDVAGGGIGITLAGGADYEAKEITVHKVLAGSPADRDGRLQKGDRILSINGHNMKGVTHQESLRILKSPSPEVVLVVMKKGPEGVSSPTFDESSYGRKATTFRTLEQLKENSTETPMEANALLDGDERGPPVNLVLCKDGAGLGFSLDGGRDSPLGDRPLTVKKIFTGGAAEKQGQLKAGDELLSVAGFDVTSMTRIEAWTLMKKLPSGPVTICVRPKTVV